MTNNGVAILGGGKMGEALLAGLLRGEHAASDVVVSEHYPERAAYLAETYGVRTTTIADAAASATTLIVATKPHDVDAVLAEVGPIAAAEHLVVSVAAGVTIGRLEAGLADGVPVVRAMPNTPALVGRAITAIAAGTHAGDTQLDVAEALLASVGEVVRVPEAQLDAVTAVSGSGPAYFYLLVESLIDAGVLLGLPRALATDLAVQTALGASTMLSESGEHPVQLREAVSSPGGTTVAAVRQLESHGLRAAVAEAVEAAAARSRELGTDAAR